MTFIDTHAHLTSEKIMPHLKEVLLRARKNGIIKIINICTDAETLKAGLALQNQTPWVYNAAATHPHDAEEETFFPLVEEAALQGKLIAIGETGLDYFYTHSSKGAQQASLLKHFSLALKAKLPVIFHCREAFADLFSLADDAYKSSPAVLHCFTGTLEEAKEVLDRGWMISISGIITFKKSEGLREVAKYIPLDRLFVETDAPYLSPQSRRKEQNEPSFLPETAAAIAEVKGISVEELAAACTENAQRFFSFAKVP
jgi:TatD DNase family protein